MRIRNVRFDAPITSKREVNWFFKLLICSYTWKIIFMKSLTNWQKQF